MFIDHGSSVAAANLASESFVQKLTEEGFSCYVAHMELSSPTIGQQVKRIYEDGLRHIIVVPLFFVNGKHMQIDVPAQIQESAAKYNDLTIATESPLLESEQFIEFMRDQLRALNQS